MKNNATTPCDDCPDLRECRKDGAVIDITSWNEWIAGERHYLPSPGTVCTKYLDPECKFVVEAEE